VRKQQEQPAEADDAPQSAVPVPKLCGADIELGNFVLGMRCSNGTGQIASRLVLRKIFGIAHSSWAAASWNRDQPLPGASHTYNVQDWGRRFLPSNGGCAYIDLNHLELCIPEVLSAHDFVAAWHAMLIVARQALEQANAELPDGQRVQVLVNNSDGQDHSYGGHLNWLVSRRTWDNIFLDKPHWLAYLASHQASSIVFAGQGKVGAENGASPVAYQLSQRADFFERMTGVQTTSERPLVNSRDEPLCGGATSNRPDRREGAKLARLHCIFYDSNLCHVANLLKCGVMQIVLAMLEVHRMNPALIIDDPLAAVTRFSHDPTLQTKVRMATGKRLTAVELQLLFCEHAHDFYERGECESAAPGAAEILNLYADTLEKLQRGDLDALAGRLDWVLKLRFLQRAKQRRPNLTWSSPEIKRLDFLYSSLDSAEGLYWFAENAGEVERTATPGHIERFLHQPPEDTRAYARAMLLRLAGPARVTRVDWDSITFRVAGPYGLPVYPKIEFNNPLSDTRDEVGSLLAGTQPLNQTLVALAQRDSADRSGAVTAASDANRDAEATSGHLPAPHRPEPEDSADRAGVSTQNESSSTLSRKGSSNDAIS
jgi:proteasome accessory factor A